MFKSCGKRNDYYRLTKEFVSRVVIYILYLLVFKPTFLIKWILFPLVKTIF